MPPKNDIPITELLRRYGTGDRDAGEQLAGIVYRTLHERAERLIQGERDSHTLRATGLVHEAWIRLDAGRSRAEYENRQHFLRLAGRVMRNVLVDHARKRGSKKRDGGTPRDVDDPTLHIALTTDEQDRIEILALHEALARLEALDPELAQIVELRYFGGLTFEETGEALGSSAATAHRSWQFARAWLLRELSGEAG